MNETIFDQAEPLLDKDGVQIGKQIRLIKRGSKDEFHRANIYSSSMEQNIAAVNAHLAEMGFPPIDPDGLARIRE